MYNELMGRFFIPRIQLIITVLLKPVHCRVGYSSDKPNKATEEKCEAADGSNYVCTAGHCCGGDDCCTYYYELWWFWLIWGVIILMSCCCAYHHRQKRREHRGRGTHATSASTRHPYAGVCNYPGPPLDNQVLGYCKLPVYDEIIRIPPTASPPPPYSSRRRSINTIACLLPNESGDMQMTIVPCHITASMLSLASISHYIPGIISQNSNIQSSVNPTAVLNGQAVDSNNNSVSALESCSSREQSSMAPPLREKERNVNVDTLPSPKPPQSLQEGCSYEADGCLLACSDLPPTVEDDSGEESDSSNDEDDYLLTGLDPNNNNQSVHPKELMAARQTPRIDADPSDALRPYDDVISDVEASALSNGDGIVLHLTP